MFVLFCFVLQVPTLFQGLFRSLNGGKRNFEMFIEDLPRDKLTARSALHVVVCKRSIFAFFFSYHDVVSEYPSVKIKKSSCLDLTLST